MQVNVINTNGIIKELEAQRTLAHSRCATIAGQNAELVAALEAAQKRIKELEAKTPVEEPEVAQPAESQAA